MTALVDIPAGTELTSQYHKPPSDMVYEQDVNDPRMGEGKRGLKAKATAARAQLEEMKHYLMYGFSDRYVVFHLQLFSV